MANSGTAELRVFNGSGTHVSTWGGEGEGPGEFLWLRAIEPWPGDSILVWYGPRRDISVFDADGNYGRSFTFETNDEDPYLLHDVSDALMLGDDPGFLAPSCPRRRRATD